MPANKSIRFSCIIPARDPREKKLLELIESIRLQDFPQDEIEIIVSTQGDSEEAKAHGIRQATGDICVMLCADNYFVDPKTFSTVDQIGGVHAVYSKHYAYLRKDLFLNRYFALLGANDPIPWFLGKADRKSYIDYDENQVMDIHLNNRESYGCNGWFAPRSLLLEADLDHYYPMDAWEDLRLKGYNVFARLSPYLWHRTSDNNLIKFLMRRYKYARDLYCDRRDRRWKVIESPRDYVRLAWFVVVSLTFIQPLMVSLQGYTRIRDFAWFWHPFVLFGFTIMYGVLVCRNILKSLLSFPRWVGGKVSMLALNLSIRKRTKTTKTSS